MKNKKGFTLVEITISVALLSLIMVFMLSFLTEIKKDEYTINEKTEMFLNKSLIAKTLNESVTASGGIKSVSCTESLCTILLNNDHTKTLELSHNSTVITYKDTTDNKIELVKSVSDGYVYKLSTETNGNLTIINIEVPSHEEYNISVVDYKSEN